MLPGTAQSHSWACSWHSVYWVFVVRWMMCGRSLSATLFFLRDGTFLVTTPCFCGFCSVFMPGRWLRLQIFICRKWRACIPWWSYFVNRRWRRIILVVFYIACCCLLLSWSSNLRQSWCSSFYCQSARIELVRLTGGSAWPVTGMFTFCDGLFTRTRGRCRCRCGRR